MPVTSPRRVLSFLCLAHGFDHMFLLLYATVVIALEAEFGMTYGELVILATPGFALFGAAAIPAGWLGDRWSARGMVAVQFLGMGAAAVLTGLARAPWQIMAGLALLGAFGAIYHPVGIALIARCAAPGRRGRELGINGIFGGVGIASATWIAGTLTGWVGWRAAFIVPGLASLAAGAAFLALVAAVPENTRPTAATREAAAPIRGLLPVMAFVILVSMGAGIVFQTTQVAMPKVFATRLDMLGGDLAAVGRAVAVVYLIGALGQLAGGWLADTIPLRRALLAVFAVQAGLSIFLSGAEGWPFLAAALALVSTTLGIQPIIDTVLAEGVPRHLHGRAYGLRFVASLATSAAGVPLVALIHDGTGGFFWLFVVLAATSGAAALVTAGFLIGGAGRAPAGR